MIKQPIQALWVAAAAAAAAKQSQISSQLVHEVLRCQLSFALELALALSVKRYTFPYDYTTSLKGPLAPPQPGNWSTKHCCDLVHPMSLIRQFQWCYGGTIWKITIYSNPFFYTFLRVYQICITIVVIYSKIIVK